MGRAFRLHRITRGSVLAGICLVATVSGVAACGSDDGDAGTGEKPAGEPIKVGFLSPELGPGGLAAPVRGQEAAVARINGELGGINGRPLDVEVCQTDLTPENNISCANRFVEQGVLAVIDGYSPGVGAALPILHDANIPVVGAFPFSQQGEADKEAFYFGPAAAVVAIAPLQVFAQEGLKTVAFTSIDVPELRGFLENFIAPAAKGMGLEFETTFYPPGRPDFGRIASTLAAAKPDVAGLPGAEGEDQCTALITALRDAGYDGTIYASFCTQFIDQLGAERAGDVITYANVWQPQMKEFAPPEVQKQLETAEADIEEVADPEEQGVLTYATYAAMRNFAEIIGGVKGEYTSSAISDALGSTKDFKGFLGQTLTCDRSVTVWPDSSTCSNALIVAKLQPNGSLEPIGGGFTEVSPDVLGQREGSPQGDG